MSIAIRRCQSNRAIERRCLTPPQVLPEEVTVRGFVEISFWDTAAQTLLAAELRARSAWDLRLTVRNPKTHGGTRNASGACDGRLGMPFAMESEDFANVLDRSHTTNGT